MNISVNNRLDAINFVIGSLGLAPVESEDEYNLDSQQAAMAIDNESRTIQNNKGQGLWFNREFNWKMTPDPVTGVVNVPNTAMATYRQNYQQRRFIKLALRGRALYDLNGHRYDMRPIVESDGYVHIMMVQQLEFDDLPETAKDAVTRSAAFRFAYQNEVEQTRLKVLQTLAEDAMFALQHEDTSQQNVNAFDNNASMTLFNHLAGGYNNWSF